MVKVFKPTDSPSPPWFALIVVAALVIAVGLFVFRGGKGDPEALWTQAERALQAGRGDEAEALVRQVAKLRAPTPLDHMLQAQIAIFHKRDDEAIGFLGKIPDNHYMAAQARLLTGQIELRRDRPRAAETAFLKAIAIDPKLPQPRRELIYIYGILLRRAELRAQFQALSEISALTFDNVFHWCLTRASVWEPKENTALLQRYVERDPGDRGSRLALAENLRQVGRRDEAERLLGALPKNDPQALVIRVAIALDRNAEEETIQALLAQGPDDDPELSRIRGKYALTHHQGEAALKHYEAAYKADPDHRETQIGMAQALNMIGDKKRAAPFVKRGRELDQLGTLIQKAALAGAKNDIGLIKSLGAACETVERYPEAIAWYNLALTANPLDSDAQKAIHRMKKQRTAKTDPPSLDPSAVAKAQPTDKPRELPR